MEVQIFNGNGFNVRTVEDNGEIWFVAKDIAEALEYKESSIDSINKLMAIVPEIWAGRKRFLVRSENGVEQEREMLCLTEQGVYFFLGRSDKPKALPYQMWIAGEVMPSIRKHEAYLTPKLQEELIANPDLLIQLAQALKAERARASALTEQVAVQTQQIAELTPKASYYDVVLACKDLMPISQISKDYGWSAKRMNEWLKEQGVQYKQGSVWLLYQKYAELGYTSTKTNIFPGKDGAPHTKVHTYWTQKGRLFIYDIMKADGNYPVMEQ